MKYLTIILSILLISACNKESSENNSTDKHLSENKLSKIISPPVYQSDVQSHLQTNMFPKKDNLIDFIFDHIRLHNFSIYFRNSEIYWVDGKEYQTAYYDCILGGELIIKNNRENGYHLESTNCLIFEGLIEANISYDWDSFIRGNFKISNDENFWSIRADSFASTIELFYLSNEESYFLTYDLNKDILNIHGQNNMMITEIRNSQNPDLKCESLNYFQYQINSMISYSEKEREEYACLDSISYDFEYEIPPLTKVSYSHSTENQDFEISNIFYGNSVLTSLDGTETLYASNEFQIYKQNTTQNSDTHQFTLSNLSIKPIKGYLQSTFLEENEIYLTSQNTINELFTFEGEWDDTESYSENNNTNLEDFSSFPSFDFTILETSNISILLHSDVKKEIYFTSIEDIELNLLDKNINSTHSYFNEYYSFIQTQDEMIYMFESLTPGTYRVFARPLFFGDKSTFKLSIFGM